MFALVSDPRRLLRWLLFLCILFFLILLFAETGRTAPAGIKTWDGDAGDGKWSSPANWSGDTLPATTDVVVFNTTSSVDATIDIDVTVAGLSIESGYTGTVTQAGALTITGAYSQADGTFVGGTATVEIAGTFTLSAGTFTVPAGTLRIMDDVSHSGGTFNHNDGTVILGGAGQEQTIAGSITFYDLEVENSGGTTDFAGSAITVTNDFRVDAGTMAGGTGTFTFTGASGDIAGSNTKRFHDLVIAAGATVDNTTGGNVEISGDFTNEGTLVSDNTFTFAAVGDAALSGAGTTTVGSLVVRGGTTLNAGSHDVAIAGSNFDVSSGGTFNGGTATITVTNSGGTTALGGAGTYNFNNLVIDTNAGLAGPTTSTNNRTFSVDGDFTNNGTFTHNAGTVVFNGSAAQVISGTTATDFSNLTLSNAGGLILNTGAEVTGTLTLDTGRLTLGDSVLTLGATASIAGTPDNSAMIVADGTGTLRKRFSGGGSFTFPVGDATGTAEYSPATLNFTGGTFGPAAYAAVRVTDDAHPQNDSTDRLSRYWTVTASGISDFTVATTFQYVDADVVGTEADLYLAQYNGSNWRILDQVDAGTNTLSDTVSSFSDFTAGNSSLPVTLAFFRATPSVEGTTVLWQTATETGNVGFNLYVATDEGRRRLNGRLIPSQAPDAVRPHTYTYAIPDAVDGPFYLEDVDVLGRTRRHGPFAVGDTYGRRVRAAPIDWARIRAEPVEREVEAQAMRFAQAQVDAVRGRAPALAPAQGRTKPASPPERSKSARYRLYLPAVVAPTRAPAPALVTLRVDRDGLYRVTYDDFLAAGLDLEGVSAAQLALRNRGTAVPLYVSTDTSFGPGEYFEFYGDAIDTLYTDTNVYTLHLDVPAARRIPVEQLSVPDAEPAALPTQEYYQETVTIDRNRAYSFGSPNGDPWYDTRLLAYTAPVSQTFDLFVDGYVAGTSSPVTLTVAVWGATDWPDRAPDHHVVVQLNGMTLAGTRFDGIRSRSITATVPAGVLRTGDNVLTITLPGDTGARWDVVMLDRYSLTYPRAFEARDDRLIFTTAGQRTVTGLSRPEVVAYRLTDAGPIRLDGVSVRRIDDAYRAIIPGGDTAATYLVSTVAALRKPTIAPARPPVDITSGRADYLILAHPKFVRGIEPLAQFHRQRGLRVRVVNVEDVYAQFGSYIFDPEAIRAYIAYAARRLGTRYVLLVGGDTYDYRNYLDVDSVSYVPSLYAATDPNIVKFAPVDPLYTDLDGDAVPDLPIGRFPVRTQAELEALVARTLAYADKAYARTALFAADATRGPPSFRTESDALIGRLPAGWDVTRAYVDLVGLQEARSLLLDRLDEGVAVTGFFGHSGPTRWSFQNLFTSTDAEKLTNAGRPTVVIQWGCWNTYHVAPTYNTLGHTLLLSGDRGAVAVLGAATLTLSSSDAALGRLVTPRLARPGTSIGDAIVGAKAELARTKPHLIDVLLGWTLLGDPALVIDG